MMRMNRNNRTTSSTTTTTATATTATTTDSTTHALACWIFEMLSRMTRKRKEKKGDDTKSSHQSEQKKMQTRPLRLKSEDDVETAGKNEIKVDDSSDDELPKATEALQHELADITMGKKVAEVDNQMTKLLTSMEFGKEQLKEKYQKFLKTSVDQSKACIHQCFLDTKQYLNQSKAEWNSELQELRNQVEKERQAWVQQRRVIEQLYLNAKDANLIEFTPRVKLNVGGTIFETTISTLMADPESMLAAMFSGKYSLRTDEKGYYFIDRNGEVFAEILDYLRDLSVVLPPRKTKLSRLRVEAEFFQLKGLLAMIDDKLKSFE